MASIKRSDLYARVWDTALARLAPELGLSDNGLRKLCGRNGIPVPKRGYWAKVAAGKPTRPEQLADPDCNPLIQLPSEDVRARRQGRKADAQLAQKLTVQVEEKPLGPANQIRPTLAGCDRLVAATARFFAEAAAKVARFKKQDAKLKWVASFEVARYFKASNGRISQPIPGGLRITASLANINWILRYNDALIRSFRAEGLKVVGRDSHHGHVVEIHGHGETMGLSFIEDFDSRDHFDSERSWRTREFIAKNSYRVRLEREYGLIKHWAGDEARLTELLPVIAKQTAVFLVMKTERRKVTEAAEAERRIEQARREEERRIRYEAEKQAHARLVAAREQIQRAKDVALACDEFVGVRRLIAELERRGKSGDDGIAEWIDLVRGGMNDPLDALVQEIQREAAANQRPLWWPVPGPLPRPS